MFLVTCFWFRYHDVNQTTNQLFLVTCFWFKYQDVNHQLFNFNFKLL